MSAPAVGTYPVYFQKYVDLVKADSVTAAVNKYNNDLIAFFKNITDKKVDYRSGRIHWPKTTNEMATAVLG